MQGDGLVDQLHDQRVARLVDGLDLAFGHQAPGAVGAVAGGDGGIGHVGFFLLRVEVLPDRLPPDWLRGSRGVCLS